MSSGSVSNPTRSPAHPEPRLPGAALLSAPADPRAASWPTPFLGEDGQGELEAVEVQSRRW